MASKAPIARFLQGNSGDIKSHPINSGNIILSKDSLELYIDTTAGERVRVSDIIYVKNSERLGLVAALPNKVYFTTDTNKFYKYDYEELEWVELNPTVTKESLGLENVDNTHDSDKSVAYADEAGDSNTVNGCTVETNVPRNAKFTDTTYELASEEANGLMSFQDKQKLDEIESQANNYVHPPTHPASMIEGLSTVATTGSYNDLTDKPDSLSDFTDDINVGGSIKEIKFENNANTVTLYYKDNNESGSNEGRYPVNVPVASGTNAGTMSAADFTKLQGIEEGANNYTHPANHPASMITGLSTVATSGSFDDLTDVPELGEYHLISLKNDAEQLTRAESITGITWNADLIVPFSPPQTDLYDLGSADNKWKNLYVMDITINGTDIDDKFASKTDLQAVNSSISEINGKITNVDNTHDKDKRVAYADEAGDANTVGGFTVGVNVPAGAKFTDTTYELATDSANGLMSSTDKAKIDGLATVATSGSYADLSGTPTNLSDFTDDIGVDGAIDSLSVSKNAGTVTINYNTVGDESHSVNIAAATSLSAGVMSGTMVSKLNGIEDGANKYTHPTSGVTAGTYLQVTVDKNGHVTDADNDVAILANGQVTKHLVPNSKISHNLGSTDFRYSYLYTNNVNASGTIGTANLSVSNNSTLNNVTIQGNLTIQGDTTTIESQTVTAKDNMILLNNGETGAGVTNTYSGIEVDRGTETNYQIVFDETDDLFKVGMIDDLEIIASRPWVDTQLKNYLKSADISDWAKAPTKPTYTKNEVGLGNVDNTADADKNVAHAVTADKATGLTLGNFTLSAAEDGNSIEFKYNSKVVARLNNTGILDVSEIRETL